MKKFKMNLVSGQRTLFALFIIFHILALTFSCPLPGTCVCATKSVTCDGKKATIDDTNFGDVLSALPDGTQELLIKYANVTKLTKTLFAAALYKVTTLTKFSMLSSNVTQIETAAFENFVRLTHLDLSGNQIVPGNFTFQELTQLKTLNLSRAFDYNPKVVFPVKLFHRLEKLETLDLSSNEIASIPAGTFKDVCLSLVELDLSETLIREIQNDMFKNCEYLTTLLINNSKLELLYNNSFNGLKNLKQLNLEGNNLHTLTVANLEPVKNATINLENNPWDCKCDYVYVMDWVKREKISLNLTCTWPRKVSDKLLLSLDANDLGCEDPEVTKVGQDPLMIIEGENGTFVIEAIGLPYVDVNCAKKNSEENMLVSYRRSIQIEKGIEKHYTNIQINFVHTKVSDSGNVTCTVKNILGEKQIRFDLQVQKKDDGVRMDIVIFVIGILVFVITVALLIACLNLRNKKKAEMEEKAKALKGQENEAFEETLKMNYARRDSMGYFPSSDPMKNA